MSSSQKFVWRFIAALIVVLFGGWICGGTINMLAALSHQMVSKIDCPAGATGQVQWKQLSFNEYGDTTMTVSCVASDGKTVTPLTDVQSRAIEYAIFYPAGVIVMAVLVAASLVFWTRRARRMATPA